MRNIVVIDLNVFVSALLGSKLNKAIYEAIRNHEIITVFCPDMLENLAAVLIRPHLKLALKDIKALLELIRNETVMVKPEIKINACRDASDNIILETAVASRADIIVSNDPDLLVLESFRRIPILSSKEFLSRLRK